MAAFTHETPESLRLHASQFETLFNHAPIGIYLVDADLRILEVNPVAMPVFGGIPGGVIGRDLNELLHILWNKDYADEIIRIFRHTLETGEPYVTPARTELRADRGVTESYEWRLDRISLPDNRHGIVCYFRDIGDRIRAEQYANLLASIVESSDDAIISKNLDGTIMSWNAAAERLFGYTASETVGQSITMLIPPERLDEEPAIIDRLKRGDRVDHFETIRVRKDGSRVNVSLTISPIRDGTGRIIGASKVARDIGERVRHERELQEANKALQQANADLQQFVYSASHDLQEPLRMVKVYSELLQHRFAEQLGDEGADFIRHAVAGASRMDTLLKDLRNYMRVSTAERDSAKSDAGSVLAKALANLEIAIRESGASITSSPLPVVRLPEFLLEQLFQNLVGNAITYRAAEPPRIAVDARLHDGGWLFSVADNGIGIEPRFQQQIFKMFARLHPVSEYPGTGMGLAICQRIVERAGGRIWVESECGKGSTFYFTIPCENG